MLWTSMGVRACPKNCWNSQANSKTQHFRSKAVSGGFQTILGISPIRAKHSFDIKNITWFYCFEAKYAGGTFCPSETEWRFLDGGIFDHNGHGWGSHSWTIVQGAEALRIVCMVCGIEQPLRIKS
jgi:hypothetical protein